MNAINRATRIFLGAVFLRATFSIAALTTALTEAHAEPAAADPPNESAVDGTFEALTGRPGGLTSEAVVARAQRASADLESRRADIERAASDLDKTILDFFPRLSTTAKYTRLNPIEPEPATSAAIQTESIDNQWIFLTSLTIPVSDYAVRLPQGHQVAKHAAEAARHDLRATARGVALEARVLYYNWVKAELSVAVAEQSLRLAEEQHDRVEKLSEAGAGTLADEASSRALVARSKLLLARTKNLASQLRAQLAIAMHDEGDSTSATASYEIGEDLAQPPKAPPLGSQSALARRALGSRPEVAAAQARIASLEWQADVARSQSWPRLDAFASFGTVNPDQRRFPATAEFHRTWQLGLSLSLSPNDAVGGMIGGGQADARTRGAVAQAAALEDHIQSEIAEARTAYRDALAGIESSESELAAAEESYRARRELFANDRATHVELTEAHDDLLHARLDAVNARIGLKIARAQLEYAAGGVSEK